jgi:hypothetical protein
MKQAFKSGLVALAFMTIAAADAAAQTVTQDVTATATVLGRARLDITGTVAFADADPQTTPTIDAAALNLAVRVRTTPTNTYSLTVQADGDFVGPDGTIPIGNLSWTTGGPGGYSPGTASSAAAVSLGTWTGPGARIGTQTYTLVNSWDYAPGTYTVTLTYTLTVP